MKDNSLKKSLPSTASVVSSYNYFCMYTAMFYFLLVSVFTHLVLLYLRSSFICSIMFSVASDEIFMFFCYVDV